MLRNKQRRKHIEFDDFSVEIVCRLGRHRIRRASGVVDQHVKASVPLHDGTYQPLDRILVPDVAAVELVRKAVVRPSCTGDHCRALVGENRTDTGPDATNTARHQHHSPSQTEIDAVGRQGGCFRMSHCASVPSKCLLR
jgi:hypothetical protein